MITILLKRICHEQDYTLGHLYIKEDGHWHYLMDTMEPHDRGLQKGMPLGELVRRKVSGHTAIPTGSYALALNEYSSRFTDVHCYPWLRSCHGCPPRLKEVPAFDGVLIHPGNSPCDTRGCILVGWNKKKGRLVASQRAFRILNQILQKAMPRKTMSSPVCILTVTER